MADQVAPPFSLVKTPTEVPTYNQLGLLACRTTVNMGAWGMLPLMLFQVAPALRVSHKLFAVNPV